MPVAQNEQARAQPTWELTQTVHRDVPLDAWSWKMSTVSTRRPDASSTTNFKPPSEGTLCTTVEVVTPEKCPHSAAAWFRGNRAASGAVMSDAAVNSPPLWNRWRYTPRRCCSFSPLAVHHCSAAATSRMLPPLAVGRSLGEPAKRAPVSSVHAATTTGSSAMRMLYSACLVLDAARVAAQAPLSAVTADLRIAQVLQK